MKATQDSEQDIYDDTQNGQEEYYNRCVQKSGLTHHDLGLDTLDYINYHMSLDYLKDPELTSFVNETDTPDAKLMNIMIALINIQGQIINNILKDKQNGGKYETPKHISRVGVS